MAQPVDTADYEKNRINQQQEKWLYLQKKTFTKWINSFLSKANMEVADIFVDLSDGRKLLKLLEIISSEKLTKPATGKMRVHKIETMNTCLAFLKEQNVKIGNIGAEDIVDGNQKLILGLVWSIILRFHIKEIEVFTSEGESLDSDSHNEAHVHSSKEDNLSKAKHSTKEALVLWCQKRTRGYEHVDVRDCGQSWRNGMAFNALIHSHSPELIAYETLNPNEHIYNLNNAFTVARDHLNIEPLLDAEDVDTDKPDEHSILTYVSSFYHSFANDGFIAADPPKPVVEPESTIDLKSEFANSTVVSENEEVADNEFELVENPESTATFDQTDFPEPYIKNESKFENSFQPNIEPELTETKVDQNTANSETNSSPLTAANEDNNNIYLWIVIVAVGFTIIRNMFQNTSQWFMSNSTDNVEPSV